MNKHTPGPWSIFTDEKHNAGIEADGFSIICIGYPDEIPAMDDSGVHGRTTDETQANARLIAAAPELLEALIELRNYHIETTGLPPVAANAAIAKAKGGTTMSDTPRTCALIEQILDRDGVVEEENTPFVWVRISKSLERELNAAKAALSGRTVSCSNCNAMAEEIAAMKKALNNL